MAKKKGRRTTNVARKREKRNRDRKSRQKQIALEKQRKLLHEKSEEAYLHACISASRKLLDEPEFEGILFDTQLMQKRVMEVLDRVETESEDTPIDEEPEPLLEPEGDPIHLTDIYVDEAPINAARPAVMSEAEEACDHFRLEVLPHLVTPDFMEQLKRALTACERRLKLTGNRDLAEVAFVTSSLFEAAPPEILAFHPMIQTIGIESLRMVVEGLDVVVDGREDVKEILSDVLAQEDSETYPSQPIAAFSNAGLDEADEKNEDIESAAMELISFEVDAEDVDLESALITPTKTEIDPLEPVQLSEPELVIPQETAPPEVASPPPTLSPDELPARALYKNFDGLAIKESFKGTTDDGSLQEGLANYTLVSESEKQVEFVDEENGRYITITEDRLQLHARSEAELAPAMVEVESHCTSGVMYLAKTVEERG